MNKKQIVNYLKIIGYTYKSDDSRLLNDILDVLMKDIYNEVQMSNDFATTYKAAKMIDAYKRLCLLEKSILNTPINQLIENGLTNAAATEKLNNSPINSETALKSKIDEASIFETQVFDDISQEPISIDNQAITSDEWPKCSINSQDDIIAVKIKQRYEAIYHGYNQKCTFKPASNYYEIFLYNGHIITCVTSKFEKAYEFEYNCEMPVEIINNCLLPEVKQYLTNNIDKIFKEQTVTLPFSGFYVNYICSHLSKNQIQTTIKSAYDNLEKIRLRIIHNNHL